LIRKSSLVAHLPFGLILIFAAILRIWDIHEFPMDSDELGSWFRATNNPDFRNHIANGVMIDGHPAGIQTIIWMFSSYFKSEVSFKIVWLCFSLLNLILIYTLTTKITNRSIALLCSIFWGFLHFPIDMSIWVRPYEIALLFELLFFYSLFALPINKKQHFIVLGISLGLTGYMHYFTLLTSIIGLLIFTNWDKKQEIKKSFIIIGIAAILQIPALGIWSQHFFNEKGLSWLGKPEIGFLFDHFYFIFNQSNLVNLTTLILVIISIYFHWRNNWENIRWGLLLIFFLAFGVVWGYSYWIKPIIQHHVLYFMLPFLLIFISNWIINASPKWLRVIVLSVIPIILLQSLFLENRHYSNCKLDKYHSPLLQLSVIQSNNTKTPILFDGPQDIFDYKRKQFSELNLINVNTFDRDNFYNQISEDSIDSFYLVTNAGSNDRFLPYLTEVFNPIQIQSTQNGFYAFPGSQINLFSKSNHNKESDNAKAISIKADSNYFLPFSELATKFKGIQKNDLIYIKCKDSMQGERHLVSAIFTPSFNKALRQIDYRFTSNTKRINDSIVIHSIKLSDIPNWNNESTLRISYENRNSSTSNYKFEMSIKMQKGNPFLYGIPPNQILSLN